MKIVVINGSMRKDKVTVNTLGHLIESLEKKDEKVESEILHIRDYQISPCNVLCSKFCQTHAFECCLKDDFSMLYAKMIKADIVILGSPLYFRAPPAKFHTFMERLVSVHYYWETRDPKQNFGTFSQNIKNSEQIPSNRKNPLMKKICGFVATAEYSNPHFILEYLADFARVLQMEPVTLLNFPYLGVAAQGEIGKEDVFQTLERVNELSSIILNTYYKRLQKSE